MTLPPSFATFAIAFFTDATPTYCSQAFCSPGMWCFWIPPPSPGPLPDPPRHPEHVDHDQIDPVPDRREIDQGDRDVEAAGGVEDPVRAAADAGRPVRDRQRRGLRL